MDQEPSGQRATIEAGTAGAIDRRRPDSGDSGHGRLKRRQPKKPATEARRAQNRESSQRYRDKRKRKLERYERLVADGAPTGSENASYCKIGEARRLIVDEDEDEDDIDTDVNTSIWRTSCRPPTTSDTACTPPGVPSYESSAPLLHPRSIATFFWALPYTERQYALTTSIEHRCNFNALLSTAIQAKAPPSALSIVCPSMEPNSSFSPVSGDYDTDRTGTATTRSSARLAVQLGHRLISLPKVADVCVNNGFRIHQVSFFAAVFANARALGYNFAEYLDEELISPICADGAVEVWDGQEHQCGKEELLRTKARFSDVVRDLQPTDIQVLVKHHLYLDLLPFPTFRSRAILASQPQLSPTIPRALDDDELCIDLLNDGLICWGSSTSGVPWDSRSWEAQDWFLEKYWFLLEDEDAAGAVGGLRDSSRWWRMIRDEAG